MTDRIRPRGRLRPAARAAGVLLLAALLGPAFDAAIPSPAGAVTTVAAQCELVQLHLNRKADGNYALRTANPGLCVMSQWDLIHLPWDLAQTAGFYVDAGTVPAANVSCFGSTVASVSAQVSVFLDGSQSDSFFTGVSFFLSDASGTAATASFLSLFTVAGGGQFVTAAGSACGTSPPGSGETTVATWNLGSVSFEDPTL